MTIANNHILDYMVDGMHDTQQALDAAGVLWGGAGDNDNLAREVTHLSYGGKNLAILAMCNRDGHYNTANPPMVLNPFSMLEGIVPVLPCGTGHQSKRPFLKWPKTRI